MRLATMRLPKTVQVNSLLERMDYSPSVFTRLSRASALGRYFAINVELPARLKRLRRILVEAEEDAHFVGNTSSKADSVRLSDSRRVVDAFLDTLPASSGLNPPQIMFVVDGRRPNLYDEDMLKAAERSYFDLMRLYFIPQAKEKGCKIVDMQPIFRDHYTLHGKRFEFPNDMHWNALGHDLCFEGIRKSAFFSKLSVQWVSAAGEQDTL